MKTKKAEAATPAGNVRQTLSDRKPAQQSRLKLQIAELLLFGDNNQKQFWPLLDIMLQQYVCLSISQNGYCGGLEDAGAKKSNQSVVG